MKEKDPVVEYAYERLTELFSYMNINQSPKVVIIKILDDTKVKINNRDVCLESKLEEVLDRENIAVESNDKFYEEVSVALIKRNQNELIGIENYELVLIDNRSDDRNQVTKTFLIINKEDYIYAKPIVKEVLNKIKLNSINVDFKEEILRPSGEELLKTVYSDLIKINYEYVKLFQLFHEVSLLRYEGSENNGSILFYSVNEDLRLDEKIRLTKPIPLEKVHYKKIRKLLEICNEDMCLLCNGVVINGVGI